MGLNLKEFKMEEEEINLSKKARLIQNALFDYVFDKTNGSISIEKIQEFLDEKIIYYTNVKNVITKYEFEYDDKNNIVATRNSVTVEIYPEMSKDRIITFFVSWCDYDTFCFNEEFKNI